MRAPLAFAFALALLAPAALALEPPLAPAVLLPEEGPTVPGVGAAVIVTVYEDDVWSYTGGVRRHDFTVPQGEWARAVIELTIEPAGDPWDRLFGIGIGSVEVLRGTTPRVPMTIQQDATRYLSLLPAGESVEMRTTLGTYVGALLATLRVKFYAADEPTAAAAEHVFDRAIGAFQWAGHCASGGRLARDVAFPAAAPSRAVVELTTTGHGGELYLPPPGPPNSNSEEFWYAHSPTPRVFHIVVDGAEVATAIAMPYVYALAGFNSQGGGSQNQAVWWTAQRVANLAGVHTGAGEIPAYRMELPASALPLLAGERTVELYAENGACVWISSVSFLLDE